MLKIYKTMKNDKLKEIDKITKGCWINLVDPSQEEINNVCDKVKINREFIGYALDTEERARIDVDDNQTLLIIDIPISETRKKDVKSDFCTIPLGIILVDDNYIVTICSQNNDILKEFSEFKIKNFYTYMKTRFILQILYKIATYYLNYLKKINKETDKAESKLQSDLKNDELIKLLSLEKSLVYFTTSLKSNEIVMERLLKGSYFKLYDDDKEFLEDAIIENKQAIEMVTINREILSGTTNAYASIISNNLNLVMRFLAAVTIVFSIPTLVSGLFGMNVEGILFSNMKYGFFIVIFISFLLSLFAYIWLKKKNMW